LIARHLVAANDVLDHHGGMAPAAAPIAVAGDRHQAD
jgi:hypothetical protein